MAFTTIDFLIFFCIVFLVYYALAYFPFTRGKGLQKWWLLIANLVFYAWASPLNLVFLCGSSLAVYLASLAIEKRERQLQADIAQADKAKKKELCAQALRSKRVYLTLAIVFAVGLLALLKYTNFVLSNVNAVAAWLGGELSLSVSWILPLGLSFYTFQNVGYLANVYWGKYPPQRNFFLYLLYISYFPHVLQGPLEEYEEMAPQIYAERTFDAPRAEKGLVRFLFGLFKKWVIASQLSVLLTPYISGESEAYGVIVVLIGIGYAIQLYADFSGYMDMAIGCSEMLGIRMAENFDTPYFSSSIAQYWRRWHISLGAWFRNYVFYPVLRSKGLTKLRKSLKKNKHLSSALPTAISLMVTWLLIGLWHGADWSYILHGAFYGIIITASTVLEPVYAAFEKKCGAVAKSKPFALFRVLRTFAIVCFGYLIFAPGDLSITAEWLSHLFTGADLAKEALSTMWAEHDYGIVCALFGTLVLFAVDLYRALRKEKPALGMQRSLPRMAYCLLLIVAILFFGAYSEADASQFLYFQF